MRLKLLAAAAALCLCLNSLPAQAGPALELDEAAALPCVLQKALARFTCKNSKDFNFIGVREGVFVYNVHFGSYWAEFFVQITGDMAVFSSKAWKGRMSTAKLIYDLNARCITAVVNDARCSMQGEARCCATIGQNSSQEIPEAVNPAYPQGPRKTKNKKPRKDSDMEVGNTSGFSSNFGPDAGLGVQGAQPQQQNQPGVNLPVLVAPQVNPQGAPGSSPSLPKAPVYKPPKE